MLSRLLFSCLLGGSLLFGDGTFQPGEVLTKPADPPFGVGMVRPIMQPGAHLYFYQVNDLEQLPDMIHPQDSLVFGEGQGFVPITYAPPWFAPEVMKLDYNLLYMRAVTISRFWVEVIVNNTDQRTRWDPHTLWVPREAVEFMPWPDFLINVYSVEVNDQESNPVRLKPDHDAGILSTAHIPLRPLAIQGSWMLVSTDGLADRIPPTGWIKWRDGDLMLITYSLLS